MTPPPARGIRIDGRLPAGIDAAAQEAPGLEAAGYDAAWSSEAAHDPFLPVAAAALATTTIRLGTGIAVAFARSPMTVAMAANDLQSASGGRFILGLGTQIRPHVERRFSMTWSRPAARMREFVLALRAIWAAWYDGARMDFRGEFYTHTLMTPFFDPGPNPFGPPPVFVAAVGPGMMRTAAEVGEGVVLHSFATERYLREVVGPAIEADLCRVGKARRDFEVAYPLFVATGRDEAELDEAARAVRQQIAFYASTPAYRGVLELEGWGEAQPEFHRLSRAGDWSGMERLVTDEMLHAFAAVGSPEAVAEELDRRCGGVADRVSFYAPYPSHPDCWQRLLDRARRPLTTEGSTHDVPAGT
jgi:probable F420-dependent oxidoreductase